MDVRWTQTGIHVLAVIEQGKDDVTFDVHVVGEGDIVMY